MAKEKRFIKVYSQGGLTAMQILVDRETGVHYLYRTDGYGGGLCVLLGKDGKPVIKPIESDSF